MSKAKKIVVKSNPVESDTDEIDTSNKYKKYDHREHILKRPGTYLGSTKQTDGLFDVFDEETCKIIKKQIIYTPGFFKTLDELIVNARDHQVRETTCTTIKISYSIADGYVKVFNDGPGIPVTIHKEENIYIPEMIFGHLLTSSNYDDTEKRVVGGMNGYGAKLANIYAKKFIVETVDTISGKKKYTQEFRDNMSVKCTPVVSNVKKTDKSYTEITYYPDFEKFEMNGLTDDDISWIKKRAYDIAACTRDNVKVYVNDQLIDIKNFKDYIDMYYSNDKKLMYGEINDRWKVGIIYTPYAGGRYVSFVNAIDTFSGGTHVKYVLDQIINKIVTAIKNKKHVNVAPPMVKQHLDLFVDATIENPEFLSQTKGELSTEIKNFGSECKIPDKMINDLLATGIVDVLIAMAQLKETSTLTKTDGKKQETINVPKLEDARLAGTKHSLECRLILTEGDSAKAFAMSGLTVIGKDKYGVFPLRGKMLNVRNATIDQVKKSQEFAHIKTIMGLKQDTKYDNDIALKKLRYGGIVILTDQDSVTGDTPLLLKSQNDIYTIKTIDNISSNWILMPNGKEESLTDFNIWTDKGWTKIVKVIRHKVNKKIYRVLTHTGVVDVTEDHSLIKSNGEEIAPRDCLIGQDLLHSFPKFNETKIDIPNDLNNKSVRELWEFAKLCKIQYYQTKSKKQLVDLITDYKNTDSITLNKSDTITQEEAYVMGLFFADGTCGAITKPIVDKYRELFYDKDANKMIPSEILNASFEVRKNFFEGYYDGDGCKASYTNSKYFDINGKIGAHGLFFLCKSLGYEVSMNIRADKPKVYTLNITKGTQQVDPIKIKKIIDLGTTEQYVYDLETENHHFQAGIGQMIVHNTDGTHIKGLIINMIQTFWPELLLRNDFIQTLVTPLIKVHKKTDKQEKNPIVFYSEKDYDNWAKTVDTGLWHVGYYKGLGTSTEKEQKQAFKDYDNRVVSFVWEGIDTKTKKPKTQPEMNTNVEDDVIDAEEETELGEDEEDEEGEENIEQTKKTQTRTKKRGKIGSSTNCPEIINSKSYDAITLAFDEDRINDRKNWLRGYNKDDISDYTKRQMTYSEFVHKEMIHFSSYDVIRSIPSIMDGLKPSQRKILHVCLKDNIKTPIKVNQLASRVSERTMYKHGETSLEGTIIGMAQDYPGANNINLLCPKGNFGYRNEDGKNFAASRYIKTYLENITDKIFIKSDGSILTYLEEEGEIVEPEMFYPILPIVLINGTSGIGTGFSTDVPKYNPIDICDALFKLLDGKILDKNEDLTPWYNGFTGTVTKLSKNKYEVTGKYDIVNNTSINISEIPVVGFYCATNAYEEKIIKPLAGQIQQPIIQKDEKKPKAKVPEKTKKTVPVILSSYFKHPGNNNVNFEINFSGNNLRDLVKQGGTSFEDTFKLTAALSTTNMYLHNSKGVITHYSSAIDIINEFYETRLEAYKKRKIYHIEVLENEFNIYKFKAQFIEEYRNGSLKLNDRPKDEVIAQLEKSGYPKVAQNINVSEDKKTYDYLLTMHMISLTKEKIAELNRLRDIKKAELDDYKAISEKDLWRRELKEFLTSYEKWLLEKQERLEDENNDDTVQKPVKKTKIIKKK